MSSPTENVTNMNLSGDIFLQLEKINDMQFKYQLPAIVYTILLMVIGTPGNIVVMYVYFFKWRKSTSRMFILFLTALDLVNCVTTLPVEIYIMRYSVILDKPWLCKISRFATYTFNSSSAAILVGIAVDRFKRICRPHGPQFSAQASKFICFGCIFVALTITWPSFIFYGTRVIKFHVESQQIYGKACLLQNEFDASILPYVYFIVMMGSTVVIFTALSILYYFVGLQVYRHRRLRMKRKAQRGVAQNLVERSEQKEDTLLQDSDSTEIRKNSEKPVIAAHLQNDTMEMKTLTTDIVKNGQVETTVADDKAEEENNVSASSILDQKEKSNTSKKKSKSIISKKACSLKNSLNKRNGQHCINMKIRIGRSTLMLFLITIAYIISFLPFYTIAIIRQTYRDFVNQLSIPGYMAYHVFLRSYLLSSAINPIIYSFCNAQFRTFCFDLFRTKEVRRGVI